MSRHQGGLPIPVKVESGTEGLQGGPAKPVYVVTGLERQGGPAIRVYEVDASYPREGGPAMPVFIAPAETKVEGGPILPVYFTNKKLYWQLVSDLLGSPLAYLRLVDTSGTTALDATGNNRNGTYNGPTLAAVASPISGELAPTFDGVGDDINIYVPANSITYSVAGSIIGWAKIAAAQWVDGSADTIISMYTSANDRIVLKKHTINNTLSILLTYGGINLGFTVVCSITDWFCWAFTWNKAQDKIEFMINGNLAYATRTGLGNWAGNLLANNCRLGGFGGGVEPLIGSLSNIIFLGRIITVTEHKQLVELTDHLPVLSVLGDSISIGSSWETWAYMTARQDPAGHVLKNHAIGGSSIIANLASQVTAAANDGADVIIIHLGTNDNNGGNMAVLQATVEAAIDDLQVSNPGAVIYYMNVLPRWTDSGGGTPVDKSNIRTAVAAACTAKGITCWDTFTVPWITAAQTIDGLHPTFPAGFSAITNQVITRL